MPEENHVFIVGDRAKIVGHENFDDGSTIALTQEDVQSIRDRGLIVREFINIPKDNLEFIGRRRCTECKSIITGEAFCPPQAGSPTKTKFFCCDCFLKLYANCVVCGQTRERLRMVKIRGSLYCPRCAEEVGRVTVNIKTPKDSEVREMPLSVNNIPFCGNYREEQNTYTIQGTLDDFRIPEILHEVRLVKPKNNFHIYGLVDRPEFLLRVEGNFAEKFGKLAQKVIGISQSQIFSDEDSCENLTHIGFAVTLRNNYWPQIVQFLKEAAAIPQEPEVSDSSNDLLKKIVVACKGIDKEVK